MGKPSVRTRLIETASELFYRQGYNLTGINEILDRSGVAKASMYQHFRSKDELCVAFLQHMDANFMEALSAYLATLPQGPDRVMGIMDFVAKFYQQDNFRGCWCLNTISEIPQDNALIKQEIQEQKRRFLAFLQRMVRENLPQAEATSLSRRLYLLYEAAVMESELFDAAWPIETAREMYALLLRNQN